MYRCLKWSRTGDVVPKQVPRPDKQVMVPGATLQLALLLVTDDEVSQRPQNRGQRRSSGLIQLRRSVVMKLLQVVLHLLAGVYA